MRKIEMNAKSCITRMKDGYFAMRYLPFRLTGNIYRGCTHDCVYCYAASTHIYLKDKPDNFGNTIYIKKNIPEIFEKELQKFIKSGKPKSVIVLGNISDSYQPVEMKYEITRKMLKLCLKYEFPCFVETKSTLILRDMDIIEKLAKKQLIGVGMTVTSYDNEFTKIIEPHIPQHKSIKSNILQKRRILTLKKLAEIGVDTYLHITPYFPGITDKDIEEIIRDASEAKINCVIMAPVELSKYIWNTFKNLIKKSNKYKYLIDMYNDLYFKNGRKLGGRYSTSKDEHFILEKNVSGLCKKYGIQYWAFTNPQFNTAEISGIYKYRYPIVIDFWNLLSKNNELNYDDARELINKFPVDIGYIKMFNEYWENGQLFEGIYGVKQIKLNNSIKYKLKQKVYAV